MYTNLFFHQTPGWIQRFEIRSTMTSSGTARFKACDTTKTTYMAVLVTPKTPRAASVVWCLLQCFLVQCSIVFGKKSKSTRSQPHCAAASTSKLSRKEERAYLINRNLFRKGLCLRNLYAKRKRKKE